MTRHFHQTCRLIFQFEMQQYPRSWYQVHIGLHHREQVDGYARTYLLLGIGARSLVRFTRKRAKMSGTKYDGEESGGAGEGGIHTAKHSISRLSYENIVSKTLRLLN